MIWTKKMHWMKKEQPSEYNFTHKRKKCIMFTIHKPK